LSGGQRQRVAIGRALVRQPDIFLFDEPLSNLDAALRVQMRIEITRLHGDLRATMIYVTHDQVEAMTMADRIVVMNGGRIEQVGDPLTLYDKPANLFVAGFIGSPKMNLVPVTIKAATGDAIDLAWPDGAGLLLPGGAGARPGPAILGVRPEHVSLVAGESAGCRGIVRLAEHLGSETLLHVDIRSRDLMIVKDGGLSRWRAGDAVTLTIDPDACHLFETTGKAIRNGARQTLAG
jgi:multiple sugar transport system ATP-binding protein